MKEGVKYIEIETKTHAERLLKCELDAILITLNSKREKGLQTQETVQSESAMRKAAKEVEDALGFIMTHRAYIENPEKYKLLKQK